MAKKEATPKLALPKFNIDIDAVKEQFQGLNGQHPGLWPGIPKFSILLGLIALFCVIAYFAVWGSQFDEIETNRRKEDELKVQYQDKIKKALNLPLLLKQKEQVLQYVGQLEKQLPSKAEMDALLTEINNAGVGRGLQFELFKPNQVIVHDYYAELPIQIKLAGAYHDFGAFTSDISNLSRIVTLNDMKIETVDRGGLMLEATAKTFRYLDGAEVAQRRKEKDDAAKKAGGAQ
jgi:type IV pilus assembly protein PilO